ncbi:MAG: hypothetical protein WKF29_08575 [Thermoleophilaceae bacterium]
MRRSSAGILAVCVGSAMAATPAGAQQAQQAPACDERPPTLEWQVRKDLKQKRSVNLRFNKYVTTGAPLKPIQVRIVRPSVARAFEWQSLNRDHYRFKRRGRERTTLTARYVENRSGYQGLGSPDPGALPLLPGLVTLPGLPTLPDLTLPLPLIPLLTGPAGGGGGAFASEFCIRTITRTVG